VISQQIAKELKSQFGGVFDELSISGGGLILKGSRIVIPESLRARTLKLAHEEGHQGVTKTTNLLRNRVWFPSIDRAVTELCGDCPICSMNIKKRPEPLKMTVCTDKPWSNLAADFFGPMPDGSELLVLKDEQSKMVLVEEVKSTSGHNVLPVIESAVSLMGIPATIKTDNGPPFNGHEFKEFCLVFGIKHTPIMPLHPEANGQCEEFMKNMNKIVKNARNGMRNWRQELNAFLRAYRSTPHSSTGVAPSEMIFNNANVFKLPRWEDSSNGEFKRLIQAAMTNNKKANETMKRNADKSRKARESKLWEGDLVLLDQLKNKKIHNKFLDQYESRQYFVEKVNGSMITIKDENGRKVTRDASWIKRGSPVCKDRLDERMSWDDSTSTPTVAAEACAIAAPRRTTRESVQTKFYGNRI